jgi:hypothetical protein
MLKMLKTMQIYKKKTYFFGLSLFFAIFWFFKNFIKQVGQKLGNNIEIEVIDSWLLWSDKWWLAFLIWWQKSAYGVDGVVVYGGFRLEKMVNGGYLVARFQWRKRLFYFFLFSTLSLHFFLFSLKFFFKGG